jgi:hypothetical protein
VNPDVDERPRSPTTWTTVVGCSVTRFRCWRAKGGAGVTCGRIEEGVLVAFLMRATSGEEKGGVWRWGAKWRRGKWGGGLGRQGCHMGGVWPRENTGKKEPVIGGTTRHSNGRRQFNLS